MRIDLLDVGKTKYGDCLVIRHGNKSILIDGAHPGDSRLIRSQLETLFAQSPPFQVDLLIVTHCHSDHIGCLPALVSEGHLAASVALVADENLGFGRDSQGHGPSDDVELTRAQRTLVAALQEEDLSNVIADELEGLLAQDATLEQNYSEMLDALSNGGTKIIRYGRASANAIHDLEKDFKDFGLTILGPTNEHLRICADAIAAGTDSIIDAVRSQAPTADARGIDLVAAYRSLARTMHDDIGFAADRPGVGAAKNDQSIVLTVAGDGWKALLGGDMQFAKPEVPGLPQHMKALRQAIVDAGPYDFVKLTHHTSYNAVDDSVLDEWPEATLFAHTGGLNDPDHPDKSALAVLKARSSKLTFARTDHNGLITVEKNRGSVAMRKSKGRFNDFTVNAPPDEPVTAIATPHPTTSTIRGGGSSDDVVEIITRVRSSARVALRIEVDAQGTTRVTEDENAHGRLDAPEDTISIAGGRGLPPLLAVTCSTRLAENIGADQARSILQSLRATRSFTLVDLPTSVQTAEDAAEFVRPRLTGREGVVLIGGFDVVPAQQLDVLDDAARQALVDSGNDGQDADNFIVWSDELYGDEDGDFLPELPVTRIPDGLSKDVILGALQAPAFRPEGRFGIRNLNRPFAGQVYPNVPGGGPGRLEISEVFAPQNIMGSAARGGVYFMLHGSARDAARFWGETHGGAAYEAIAVECVPKDARGTVVFTGCCWGALTMSPPAGMMRSGMSLQPRRAESSVALAYLRSGALAFVGCTGSHYSPLKSPYDYFGKPIHDAFWQGINGGRAPARALFDAKREFARRMPHGQTDPFSRAVELKLVREYTCLGLGW